MMRTTFILTPLLFCAGCSCAMRFQYHITVSRENSTAKAMHLIDTIVKQTAAKHRLEITDKSSSRIAYSSTISYRVGDLSGLTISVIDRTIVVDFTMFHAGPCSSRHLRFRKALESSLRSAFQIYVIRVTSPEDFLEPL